MDANEFRRMGHDLEDWSASYRERIETLPVMSAGERSHVEAPWRSLEEAARA